MGAGAPNENGLEEDGADGAAPNEKAGGLFCVSCLASAGADDDVAGGAPKVNAGGFSWAGEAAVDALDEGGAPKLKAGLEDASG